MMEMRAGEHLRGASRMVPMLTALALVLAVAGCSQMPTLSDLPDVPDWANPVTWVDGMFDSSDDVESLPKAPTVARGTPEVDKPFPKLSDAPAAKSGSSPEGRKALARSLVADRDNARYTDQNLRAGDQRMAAAPPPPAPAPKPAAPLMAKQTSAVPAARGTAALPASPSLPPAPTHIAGDLTQVPSIVQRRGGLPPPPAPITEVSRGVIPQIIQKPSGASGAKQMAGLSALPKPPAIMPPTPTVPSMAPAAPASATAPLRLIPPTTTMPAAMPASVQVNLPVGQEQSVLAQTFAASLAAQNSPVVRQPGSVFNAPNAAPISGQWTTVVPGVVRQAFNASLNSPARGTRVASAGQFAQQPLIASPQMSNAALRRLPGAPMLVRFRHGSTHLSGKEKQLLGRIASTAKSQGGTIYVVGHASQRTGDMNYAKHKMVNFGVSLDRANRVAGELRRRGVAAAQIVVQAKGDSEPLYFEYMPDGEAKNRRVEIFIR